MYRTLSITLLTTFFLMTCKTGFANEDVTTMLNKADSYRLSADEVRVDSEIRLFKHGKLDKERQYSVFIKPGRRSLVLFRHAAEKGQRMLMLDDKFWMILPRSRRPIRITANQKLLGEASSGDIATLTWGEDYQGEVLEETEIDNIAVYKLMLSAKRKGVSYKKIILYLERERHVPVQAELYLSSGKLAKLAHFEMGEVDGRRMVKRMILEDHLQKNRQTVIEYTTIRPQTIPDKAYNPYYLTKNALLDW